MALQEIGKGEYRIPERHFRSVFDENPWRECVYSGALGVARTIDDAVQLARSHNFMLPSAQELVAYLLSAGDDQKQQEYWLRTGAYFSQGDSLWRMAIFDEAQEQACVVHRDSADLSVSHGRFYLARAKRGGDRVEAARYRSSLERRTMDHPGFDSFDIHIKQEQDIARYLAKTVIWEALFGGLACAFGKRVYRLRQKKGLSVIVRYEFPPGAVLERNRYQEPEGMRAVRIGPLDGEAVSIRFDGSFRQPAAVIGIRKTQDFYPAV